MPPKKEVKEKPLKADEAEECILQYMKTENRPYSSTDVSTNLKGKVAKPAAQKIMAALAEKGSLTVKAYGKQTIFVYNQAQLEVASGDELAGLDEQLKEIKEELEQKKKDYKMLSSELAAKIEQPKTKDVQAEINTVKNDNTITLKALLPYRGDDQGNDKVEPMSDEDIKKIDQDFLKWRKQWVDRKKVYKHLLDLLTEGGGITDTNQFEDDQGINKDEDEAKDVEEGEFCRPQPIIRKTAKRSGAATAMTTVKAVKRVAIDAPSSVEEESQPKKKAKKVKS